MRLSNFKMVSEVTLGPPIFRMVESQRAEVDVTTGFLFWKKTVRRQILRKSDWGNFFFTDTGRYCPGTQSEQLARAWEAQNRKAGVAA
jgi:hypothetical protein